MRFFLFISLLFGYSISFLILRLVMTAEDFFKRQNAHCIEDLSHVQLLSFALECMDLKTAASANFFRAGYDFLTKPLYNDFDKAVIKAYKEGKSVDVTFTLGESCNGVNSGGKPGYTISVVEC